VLAACLSLCDVVAMPQPPSLPVRWALTDAAAILRRHEASLPFACHLLPLAAHDRDHKRHASRYTAVRTRCPRPKSGPRLGPDTANPHPYAMSFRLDRFLKTFRTRRKLRSSTGFAARNRKKAATTLDFQNRAASGDAEQKMRLASKVLRRFADFTFL
jgi:hypothetical protein